MSNVVKQLAGGGGGQSLMDRVTAAKHSISGAGLAKVICKATTEEQMTPKKKHLYFIPPDLVECTNESNISIPELANELLERLKHQNWVVVFKTLISIHHLMNYGNERFTQYLASNNCSFALLNFSDKSSVQGADMSRFICRYSAYVQEKAIAYRSLAFDFCKIKRGSEDAVLRTMSAEKLLKSLPVLIAQFDSLLSFDARGNELSNAVISAAFALMYRDATRLFVAFNDGIINLLSKFFEAMSKKQCKESLEIYRKFVTRSERLNEFSKVAEYIGIERPDVTRLEKHPASFLEAMESHLAHLEGRSRPAVSSQQQKVSAASGMPRSASSSGGLGAPSSSAAAPKLSQVLLEEQQQLDRLKAEQMQRQTAANAAAKPAQAPASVDDFFLIGSGASTAAPAPVDVQQRHPAAPASPFVANFPALNNAVPQNSNGFDPFGSVLQPVSASSGATADGANNNKSA
uniref:ENTH domain-containing protein n=1 Tax=Macrostomum lignano TaxID=282301 RepID=A0A1I8IL98_9PLAT